MFQRAQLVYQSATYHKAAHHRQKPAVCNERVMKIHFTSSAKNALLPLFPLHSFSQPSCFLFLAACQPPFSFRPSHPPTRKLITKASLAPHSTKPPATVPTMTSPQGRDGNPAAAKIGKNEIRGLEKLFKTSGSDMKKTE